MFEKIRGFFMNILKYFHTQTVEEITGVNTNITADCGALKLFRKT